MAKTEDIEAKLAAYVDGELDETGRAQIEQHLVDHPQHRALIKDLMQQKQLVASLPRMSAPPEVAETFNSQLERAVLLGDVDGGADQGPTLRIGYFAHIRAVAAILLLTTGLAGAIWYLLPSGNRTPQLADVRPTPAPMASAAPTSNPMDLPLVAEKDFDNVVAQIRAADEQEHRAADAANTVAMAGSGAGRGGRGGGGAGGLVADGELAAAPAVDDAGRVDATRREFASVTGRRPEDVILDQFKLGPPSPARDSFVYVFATDNPTFANQQVTSYLTSNGITWENESEPMPAPLNLGNTQNGFASRMIREDVAVKNAAPRSQADASQVAQQTQQQNMQQASNRIIARQVPRSRAIEVAAGLDRIQGQVKPEPLSLQNSAVVQAPQAQPRDKDAIDLASRQMARATGLVESNVHSKDEFAPMAAPTTMPFGATNYAPTIEMNDSKSAAGVFALSPPATQPTTEESLLRKDTSKLDLNAAPAQPQDLVDMVIVVQPGEAVPTTQPISEK